MDTETAHHLLEINRRFYERFAESFSASRSRPWPGWTRVLRHLPEGPLSVLDVGCGNARLATHLKMSREGALRYVGLDNCLDLLEEARARLAGSGPRIDYRLEPFEIGRHQLGRVLAGENFDMVCLYGVLHHVPGWDRRQQLLVDCAQLLGPAGLLALTVWRLDQTARFTRKTISWESYNLHLERMKGSGTGRGSRLELQQLEPGDHLLTWSGDTETPRYCHFPSDSEIGGWLEYTGLRVLDRFDSDGRDGRDNHYLLLIP